MKLLAAKPSVPPYLHLGFVQIALPANAVRLGSARVLEDEWRKLSMQGPKTVYYGRHRIPLDAEPAVAGPPPTFCFMKGPHHHEYPQPEGQGCKLKDNVIFYVGPGPPQVAAVRPQIEQALEVEYRPYVAQRPQVVVTPPPEWAGVVWVAPPPTVVVALAPNVVIAPAAPVIVAPHPAVIVAPPPVIFMHGYKGKGKCWGPGWGRGKAKGHWKHW